MLLSIGTSALRLRFSQLFLAAVIGGFLFHFTRPYRQLYAFALGVEDTTSLEDVVPEEEYLETLVNNYGLTNFTKWQTWRILSSGESVDTSPITTIRADFQPHRDTPKVVDVHNPSSLALRASKRMQLPIHAIRGQEHLSVSSFLFGTSTSYKRIADKDWAVLRAWKRWLTTSDGTSNGAGLVLILNNATQQELEEIDTFLHDAGIQAYTESTIEHASKTRRYFDLIHIMKSYSATLAATGQEKHWFGVLEDTIFFPSLSYLQKRLSTYNCSERLYIGIPSEKMDWQKDGASVTTYGGGAIFMTRAVLTLIPELPCLNVDSPRGTPFRFQKWDIVLKQCVKKWIKIDMHVIPAFYSPHDVSHRLHLKGHETGIRPLLLHDYQARHQLDVGMAHLVTDVCGDACFMRQYLFHDNWAIINGVSISHHPDGLNRHLSHKARGEKRTVESTERTLISGQIVVENDNIESRPLDWTGRRNVWKLLDSSKAANGSIWQAYIKKGTSIANETKGGHDEFEKLDSVIVLIWEKQK